MDTADVVATTNTVGLMTILINALTSKSEIKQISELLMQLADVATVMFLFEVVCVIMLQSKQPRGVQYRALHMRLATSLAGVAQNCFKPTTQCYETDC